MSNGIYDILGKLNGLQPKDNPVSMSSEPVYESIDLQDITPAVDSLEEKYQNFLAEEKSIRSQQKDAKISRGEPEIVKLLNKARLERPAAASDTEALAYQMVKANKELEKATAANDEQEIKIANLQTKVGTLPTAKPAVVPKAITPTPPATPTAAQTQEPAQAKAEPTVDRLATLVREPAVATAPAATTTPTQAEPEVATGTNRTYKSTTQKSKPGVTTVDDPLAAVAPQALPKNVIPIGKGKKAVEPEFDNNLDPMAALGTGTYGPGDTADMFGGSANDSNLDVKDAAKIIQGIQQGSKKEKVSESKRMLKENIEMLTEYAEGSPQLAMINWNTLIQAWKNRQPKVDLQFGNRGLTIWKDQMYAILSEFATDQNADRRMQRVEDVLSSYDSTIQFMMLPRVKKFVGLYPNFEKNDPTLKAAKAQQKAIDKTGQQHMKFEETTMQENVKTSSILQAVHQVEDKKLRESAKPDFLDLDKDGDTDEPMKSAAKTAKDHEPDAPDESAVAKRKRLQALKDKQEDERAEKGDDYKSASRFVKGHAYGGSAQKDDKEDDLDETQEIRFPKDDWSKNDSMAKPITSKQAMDQHSDYFDKKVKLDPKTGNPIDEGRMKDIYTDMTSICDKKGYSSHKQFTPADYDELAKPHGISGKELAVALGHKKVSQVEEVAPPGAKAERMVKHIKKGYSKDGNLTKREKGIAYATAWKAHNKGQVEEGTNFGDTIKNSGKGKMTKVTVKEGINGDIAHRPLYRVPEAWNHYTEAMKQEAMEESMMETPAVNVQQELDEIAALAGLPPKMESKCSSCGCADCKCGTLDEAATRKDFRMVADLIKQIPDADKRKELAHHHSGIFKQQNPRFKHDVFCKACGVDECDYNMGAQPTAVLVGEDEMDEGNEYTKARLDAIAQGLDSFTVGNKTHRVTGDTSDEKRQVESVNEDINVNITANGEQDALNLLRKLSGMAEVPQVVGIAIPMGEEQATCEACGMTPCGCEQAVEEERDINLANTPNETVAPISAVTTDAGGGLGGAKKQYPLAANRGANPLEEQVEESIWAAYESMINDVKA
jgi:hypothetical protein